ncbi:MAG: NAD(P)H-dependent oxidoreductase [Terrisporobacter othiniensis]|uniref:NAD(P)H-dependent oxidoreductase n=1 Tax=Terrisporobacter petrolearius TaxID=1460447 RepID=UPI0022E59ACE|nr:NAD(P)H-dependent oxidoreductase [Terrisporobacter petrolearius]MDU4861119.1 NAD(P)H-dependent oxidoreductase [Terrisporobacter othiniensis]MDU6994753.1 NAD(P)H-dependent oxidoreductase [Terrisporobacter othiniensis]
MNTTVIVANPSKDSFSKSIMEQVLNTLKEKDKSYEIIDLYNDDFNPIMSEEDVKLYTKGETKDELVKKYQKILKETNQLVCIFPIWWNSCPAILKGFFDRVFLKEFAFTEKDKRPVGLLTNITSGLVITTSETDTDYMIKALGNPIEATFVKGILNMAGATNVKWINENLADNNEESKNKFLHSIASYV